MIKKFLSLEVMSRVIPPKREASVCEEPLARQAKDEKIVVMLVAGLVLACMVVGCVSKVDPFGNPIQTLPPRQSILSTPTPSLTTQAAQCETPTITPTPQVATACTLIPTPTTITRATPSPTPPPSPVSPVPGVERHRARIVVPIHDGDATTPGILVWDPGGSRGLYPYYTHGDHAVLELRFVNTIPRVIKDPVVEVAVERDGALVACWRQVVDAIIPGATRENPSPSYTTRLEYDITEAIPPGDYTIKVTVIVDNTNACQIRKTITIYSAEE